MSFKPNGRKRDLKRVLSAIFIFGVGLLCLYFAFNPKFRFAWLLISLAVMYFGVAMFKNSNEL